MQTSGSKMADMPRQTDGFSFRLRQYTPAPAGWVMYILTTILAK